MHILHSVLAHCWAIPFSLALLIRRRGVLLAVAAGITPLLIGSNLGGDARFATGSMLALGMAFSLVLGRATGALLASRYSSRIGPRFAGAVLVIGGILLLPGRMAAAFGLLAHATTLKIQHWEARTPPRACLARTYPVSVGGARYRLPAASVITVRTAGRSYHFQYSPSLRSACSRAAQTSTPVHATNLNFDFSIPVKWEFCSAARGAWSRALCQRQAGQAGPASARFPAMVNIYMPREYDSRHWMAGPAYARFVDAQNKARAGGHPFAPQAAGAFRHYADGYWVATRWHNEAGEPYTLHCDDTDEAGRLSCETSYRLRSGPTLSYSFTARRRALARTARALDDGLHAMLAEFSVGPAPRRGDAPRHHRS